MTHITEPDISDQQSRSRNRAYSICLGVLDKLIAVFKQLCLNTEKEEVNIPIDSENFKHTPFLQD